MLLLRLLGLVPALAVLPFIPAVLLRVLKRLLVLLDLGRFGRFRFGHLFRCGSRGRSLGLLFFRFRSRLLLGRSLGGRGDLLLGFATALLGGRDLRRRGGRRFGIYRGLFRRFGGSSRRFFFLAGFLLLFSRLFLSRGLFGLGLFPGRFFLLGLRFLFLRLGVSRLGRSGVSRLLRTTALAFFLLRLRLFGSDGSLLVQDGITQVFGIHSLGAFDPEFVCQCTELIFSHGIQLKKTV